MNIIGIFANMDLKYVNRYMKQLRLVTYKNWSVD